MGKVVRADFQKVEAYLNTQATYREGIRMFDTEIVTFVEPFTDLRATNGALIYVGVLHSSGSLVKGQPRVKEAIIGSVKVLNM